VLRKDTQANQGAVPRPRHGYGTGSREQIVSTMRHGDGAEQGVLREKAHMAMPEPRM